MSAGSIEEYRAEQADWEADDTPQATVETAEQVRFWARVKRTDRCWLWTGSHTTAGYGNLRVSDGYDYAHRVAYRLIVGPIPDGLVLDHLCRNRGCCNPDHLEPVTQAENVRRGEAGYGLRTTCKRGHDVADPLNVRVDSAGGRQCRKCDSIRNGGRRSSNWPRTHCPQGHPYDEANTYVTKAGHRQCRACNIARTKARRA